MTSEREQKTKSGFVALVGRPNVGKSSFLNKLLGQKIAIVSPKVQTTRTKILGVHTYPNASGQAVFLDLPGMHKPVDKLGDTCLKISLDGAKEADLIIFMSEARLAPGKGDTWISQWLSENCSDIPHLIVLNKKDLAKSKTKVGSNSEKYLGLFEELEVKPRLLQISCLENSEDKDDGLEELTQAIFDLLPEGPLYFPEDVPTNRSLRFLSAELIREQVLLLTDEEVPHSCAVEIVQFKEETTKKTNEPIARIQANILVETESQKGIVVGKKGSKIKEIGMRARQEIEKLVESKVFLELKVKKSRNWRNNQSKLKDMNLVDD